MEGKNMSFENLRVGYIILFLGGIMTLIEMGLVIWVSILAGEYKPFDSHSGLYTLLVGFAFIKIDKILDNQKEIKHLGEHIAFSLLDDKTAIDDFLKHHPDFPKDLADKMRNSAPAETRS